MNLKPVSEKITNNCGIAPLLLIAILTMLICLSLWAWADILGWNPFTSKDYKAEITREKELTARAEIKAADRQAGRESFNQTMILFLSGGRELLFVMAVAAVACVSALTGLGLILAFLSHRETMARYHLQAMNRPAIDHHQTEPINYLNDSHVIDYNPNV